MISAKWFETFRGTPEQREQLQQSIQNSSFVLNLLSEIVQKEIARLETTKIDDYSTPNWGLLTADKIGQARAYRTILELTKLRKT